jgi:hypothetical protein
MSERGNDSRCATVDKSVREPNREGIKVQIGKSVNLSDNNSSVFALENAEQSHRYAVEEQESGCHKNMRRICEDTCDFAPAEHLIVLAIRVGVTTPIIRQISAI